MRFRRLFILPLIGLAILGLSLAASAQLKLPQISQSASVSQTIGVTDITIKYSRPAVKGRKVFGDWPSEAKGEATLDNQDTRPKDAPLVPWGHVWRTGANDATVFAVSDDVMINGKPLPAGTYSLHTIPGKDEWTIVFNGDSNQWGSFDYDAAKDALRVTAKPEWVVDSQEFMGFSIDPSSDNSATVNIRWEKARVPFTVVVDVPKTTIAKARLSVDAAKPDDWRTPFQASGYANQNGDKQDAVAWYTRSLKILDESIATKPTFQNLSSKATVLIAGGRQDEGLALADKAIAQGKIEKADTSAFEKRIADIRAAKK